MSVEKVDQSIKKELLDPTIVVEDLIGTALTDPGSNGALSTPNLRQEAEAAALESSTSSPVKETEITKPQPLPYPTVAKILKFAIPSIGVYLCSPLLSLIDTSSVGLLSGTTQQAAQSSRSYYRLWSTLGSIHVHSHNQFGRKCQRSRSRNRR